MKTNCSRTGYQGFTIIELLVVVVTLSLLGTVAIAQIEQSRADAERMQCVNHLKQIALATRIWGGDNDDKYPIQVSAKMGGAKESAEKGDVARIFLVMSNELSTTQILVCPADTNRVPATSFFTAGFDKSHISYFFGLDATEKNPAGLLSGDSNLAVDGVPVKSGLANVPANGSASWTADWHVEQGNVGLSDGSVRTTTTRALNDDILKNSGASRVAVP
jgi:type II secretory pathway pseudopilin PulG